MNTPLAPAGGFGFPELAVRPLGGGAPDILWSNQVEQGRFVVGRPAFAPDGSRIAFSATKPGNAQCAADLMVVDADGAPNPRSIGCESATEGGSVDWAVRTAKGLTRLVSSLPGSTRESGDGTSEPATVAANGRYAVFTSAATNLVAGRHGRQREDRRLPPRPRLRQDRADVDRQGRQDRQRAPPTWRWPTPTAPRSRSARPRTT